MGLDWLTEWNVRCLDCGLPGFGFTHKLKVNTCCLVWMVASDLDSFTDWLVWGWVGLGFAHRLKVKKIYVAWFVIWLLGLGLAWLRHWKWIPVYCLVCGWGNRFVGWVAFGVTHSLKVSTCMLSHLWFFMSVCELVWVLVGPCGLGQFVRHVYAYSCLSYKCYFCIFAPAAGSCGCRN